MSDREPESAWTRVWGSWKDTTPRSQPLPQAASDLLDRLPLDLEQRESAARALEHQSSRVVARFEAEASGSLSRLDSLNAHMAGLRRTMEVVASANASADQALQEIDTSFS